MNGSGGRLYVTTLTASGTTDKFSLGTLRDNLTDQIKLDLTFGNQEPVLFEVEPLNEGILTRVDLTGIQSIFKI